MIGKVRELFARYIGGDRDAIIADLMAPVFRVVIRHSADGHEMEQLMQLYPDVPSTVQTTILCGLGAAPTPPQVSKALEFAMSDKVRNQDLIYILHKPIPHPQVLWQWLSAQFDELYKRYADSPSLLHYTMRGVMRGIVTGEGLDRVKQFFVGKDTAKYKVVLDQTLEEARINVAWLQRDRGQVASWLAVNVKP